MTNLRLVWSSVAGLAGPPLQQGGLQRLFQRWFLPHHVVERLVLPLLLTGHQLYNWDSYHTPTIDFRSIEDTLLLLIFFFFFNFFSTVVLSQWDYSHGKFGMPSPGKARYPTYGACWVYLSVSVIHRTLTWTTGSLTCAQM